MPEVREGGAVPRGLGRAEGAQVSVVEQGEQQQQGVEHKLEARGGQAARGVRWLVGNAPLYLSSW